MTADPEDRGAARWIQAAVTPVVHIVVGVLLALLLAGWFQARSERRARERDLVQALHELRTEQRRAERYVQRAASSIDELRNTTHAWVLLSDLMGTDSLAHAARELIEQDTTLASQIATYWSERGLDRDSVSWLAGDLGIRLDPWPGTSVRIGPHDVRVAGLANAYERVRDAAGYSLWAEHPFGSELEAGTGADLVEIAARLRDPSLIREPTDHLELYLLSRSYADVSHALADDVLTAHVYRLYWRLIDASTRIEAIQLGVEAMARLPERYLPSHF